MFSKRTAVNRRSILNAPRKGKRPLTQDSSRDPLVHLGLCKQGLGLSDKWGAE